MVVVVVQPDNHGRVAGEFDEDVLEAAEAGPSEHIYLVQERARLVELGVSGGEQAVPEEGELFLQRRVGGYHAVDPVRAGAVQLAQFGLVNVVSADEVVGKVSPVAGRVYEVFDDVFVALGDKPFEFLPVGSESGASHEVRHKGDVCGGHLYLLLVSLELGDRSPARWRGGGLYRASV